MEVSVSRGLATEVGESHGAVLPPDLLVVGGYKAFPQRLFGLRVLYCRMVLYQVGELRFCRQADSHRALSKGYERRAEKLCEEGNPGAA